MQKTVLLKQYQKIKIMGLQIKTQEQEIKQLKISELKEGTIFKIDHSLGIRVTDLLDEDKQKVLAIGINSTYGYWIDDRVVDEVLPKGTILEVI